MSGIYIFHREQYYFFVSYNSNYDNDLCKYLRI